ncbi:MAG: tetratricopeptide repeat protein [Desulfobacterales bacterium]
MDSKSNQQNNYSATQLGLILERGLSFHRRGDLCQAEKDYREILKVMPMNADALHLLGVLSNQKQENKTAVDLITRAIEIHPNQPIYHNNLGNVYRDSGNFWQAIFCYQKALEIKPDFVEVYVNLGIAYHQIGDLDRAASTYQNAIMLKPDSAEAYYNLGNALKERGLFDEAISCYQRSAALNPMLVESFYNQANILEKIGRFEEAIICLKKCIHFKPDWAEARSNLGNLLKQQGFLDDAILHYRQAINLKPELDAAYNNLGNALKDHGSFVEAIVSYHKALQICPGNADAYFNLGVVYAEADGIAEAIECFQKAIRLKPKFAEAHNYMGLVLAEQGRRDEAIDYIHKAIEIRPDYVEAYSYLTHQLQYTCNWDSLKIYSERLDELSSRTDEGNPFFVEPPFIGMARHFDLDRHLKNSMRWCRKFSQPLKNVKPAFRFDIRRQEKQKLTIGYLSSDFHDHATAHLVVGLFKLHDRNQFNVYCYSYGPDDNSLYRQQIQTNCDQFIDIRNRSLVDAAGRINADRVDILVELKGHTKGARLGILACRPAPIQVHYLGYPGTTGADFIDYLITDKIVTPIEHMPFYSENLVFLPHSYQVNDHKQEIAPHVLHKEDFGLPPDSFVFSSFNLSYKIDRIIFDCWMRILNRVPHGVLWLLKVDETAKQNLKQEAASRGIDSRRLIFADKLPKAQHLTRIRLADLALDTRIVNGHTTTSDSLWAGVPVATLLGSHFASRVSASLLNAVGLSEMITQSLDEYERLAVRLASQPDALEKIKAKLSRNRIVNPLFDTPRFVGNLEKAYQEMWRIFIKGGKAKQFEVVEERRRNG